MNILWLAALVLLVGIVTYRILKPLVVPVRVVGTGILMLLVAALIVHIRASIAHQGNDSGALRFSNLSDPRALNVANPAYDPGFAADEAFQTVSKEDRLFLDAILRDEARERQGRPAPAQVQDIGRAGLLDSPNEPILKAELVINTAEVRRAELVTHPETVRRAQLVTHNEPFKRAELVRTRQQ
jgi:hypothetical protein